MCRIITKHPFHLVSPSPLPLLASFSSLLFVTGLVLSWSNRGFFLLFLGSTLLFFVCISWWYTIVLESTFIGFHTSRVQFGLRFGICLFILSEIFFFLGFFWAYFHCSLSPNVELGSSWPPVGILALDPFLLPLVNTLILLTSGATVTWSHCSLKDSAITSFHTSLTITLLLGLVFSLNQVYEFFCCSFTIADGAYGSCFFLATGFHGLHVIIGTLFLGASLVRGLCGHFTPSRHLGFEFATWYWHFVDVVWVLLFLFIYIWGS